MSNNYFETIRAGVNTTFQDKGRNNLYHIGIPFSGAMDNRNYLLANKLVGNKLDLPVIEFAYQGPLLRFYGDKINIVITGDVVFKIKQNNKEIDGNCYETYELRNEDEINILSTNKSVYGYLAISGKFDLKLQWGSCSINTKANIGSNDGKKLKNEQKIKISKVNENINKKKINYQNSKIENIRIIKGTNFDYFSENGKKIFLEKKYTVSKLSDRMGMRLEGPKIENIVNTNIKSEGLLKGVIQVPADGNPIIMLSDHGTIGGYPKIAVVASVDYDRLVQISPGSKISANQQRKKTNYLNSKVENIRVIKGTNFNYFSEEGKNNFFEKEFTVSKLSDRMGMRLNGPEIENIVNTNIKSEGLLKGVIQVPADGNPIIMLSDHGTIGGYPKIAVVASVDYDRLVQISPGSKIKFKEIELPDAETLFKLYEMETQNLLSQI